MANADPARPVPAASSGGSELTLRILSGLVLAPLAVGVAYLGGWIFVAFWAIAALTVLWEWCTLVAGGERRTVLLTASAAVLLAVLLAGAAAPTPDGSHSARLVAGGTLLVMGVLATAALAPSGRRVWTAAGIPYAGLLGMAPVVLRNAPLLRDGTPMPTRYWLVGEPERTWVSRLESAGGVDRAEAEVDPEAVVAAHARYAAERDAAVPGDHVGHRPTGGVGGTRVGLKCLHAHYAWHLAGGDDPVGRWVEAHLPEVT